MQLSWHWAFWINLPIGVLLVVGAVRFVPDVRHNAGAPRPDLAGAALVALAVGALGNLLGSAITGLDPVWDISVQTFSYILLANILGMLMGFMLGVLFRSSAAAIVGYFVYSLVLPTLFAMLANFQEWFRDIQG